MFDEGEDKGNKNGQQRKYNNMTDPCASEPTLSPNFCERKCVPPRIAGGKRFTVCKSNCVESTRRQ